VKRLPQQTKRDHPRSSEEDSRTADILVHDYFGIDMDIVWT